MGGGRLATESIVESSTTPAERHERAATNIGGHMEEGGVASKTVVVMDDMGEGGKREVGLHAFSKLDCKYTFLVLNLKFIYLKLMIYIFLTKVI
jgi:hypothetical protein